MANSTSLPARFLPLDSPQVTLETAGGKALNLARLHHANFPVPNGFIISTKEYSQFIADHEIGRTIQEELGRQADYNPAALDLLSAELQGEFLHADLSVDFKSKLRQAYDWLAADKLAVRSSATAEDLPQASFAGQQATYLNIVDFESLAKAVIKCWASLWTARAISYRHQNDIDQSSVTLAVIVQRMIPSLASGVMFTADPLTGLRDRIHIDAAHGLGEAVVSGEVEPDHYVVSKSSGQLIVSEIGNKSLRTIATEGGGVTTAANPSAAEPSLSKETILRLADYGADIERLFEIPQDIEWAIRPTTAPSTEVVGKDPAQEIFILQSRPITSLFPLPTGVPAEPPHFFLFFGTVQGLVDPMTPIGQDAIRLIFAGGASLFGIQVDHQSQGVVKIAGERLWMDFTAVLRHPIGAKLMPRFIGAIEPGSQAALGKLISDETMQAGSGRLRFETLWRVGRFASRLLWRTLLISINPEGKARAVRQEYRARIRQFELRSQISADEHKVLDTAVESLRQIRQAFVYAVPEIGGAILAGLLPLFVLTRLSKRLTGSQNTALEITRGLPHNVTTEMDLALWQTSRALKKDSQSLSIFQSKTSQQIAELWLAGSLHAKAQRELTEFLEQYGMRGLAEIDLGRPRWAEMPAPVIQTLQSYLQMADGQHAPDVVFERGKQSAQQAIDKLVSAARQTAFGSIKARLIRTLARRVRALAGLRESPKFFIIQLMWITRQLLLAAGQQLAERALLDQPDDIFFLSLIELEAMGRGESRDWRNIIAARRASYQRELRRRQVPRLLLSDGQAFYGGMVAADGGTEAFEGSPVSPGIAEGRVRVVEDPHQADLSPGEIMVCRGTDPSWTPLFLAAGGLVMELGGMMTHGAIVAREYGIPAVVGVDNATQRLQTGDRIRLDGGSGAIEIMERN